MAFNFRVPTAAVLTQTNFSRMASHPTPTMAMRAAPVCPLLTRRSGGPITPLGVSFLAANTCSPLPGLPGMLPWRVPARLDRSVTAQLNLQFSGPGAKRYHLGSHLSTIEIGGKFRNAHKFADTFTDNFSPSGTGTPLLLSQFSNKLTNNNYYNGAYKLGPNPNFFDIY